MANSPGPSGRVELGPWKVLVREQEASGLCCHPGRDDLASGTRSLDHTDLPEEDRRGSGPPRQHNSSSAGSGTVARKPP